jgi:hypothetical protein
LKDHFNAYLLNTKGIKMINLEEYCCQATGKSIVQSSFKNEDLILKQSLNDKLIFSPLGNNPTAPIIALVGITPGAQYKKFAEYLRTLSVEQAAKKAAFTGGQTQIKQLLKAHGFADKLGIDLPDDLNDSPLIFTTSLVKCCVKRNEGYVYKAPDIVASDTASHCVKTKFYQEIAQYPSLKYVIIFGKAGWDAINYMQIEGVSIRERLEAKGKVLLNFPHFAQNFQQRKLFCLSPRDAASAIKISPDLASYAETAGKLREQVLSVITSDSQKRITTMEKAKVNSAILSANKGNNRNLAALDGFIAERYEQKIRQIIQSFKLNISFPKSRTSKEMTIYRHNKAIAYINRKTGLKKGIISIIVKPPIACKLDHAFGSVPAINISSGKQSRYISSSNYRLFNNAGQYPEIDSKEHVGAAYRIEYDEQLDGLKTFMDELVRISL